MRAPRMGSGAYTATKPGPTLSLRQEKICPECEGVGCIYCGFHLPGPPEGQGTTDPHMFTGICPRPVGSNAFLKTFQEIPVGHACDKITDEPGGDVERR